MPRRRRDPGHIVFQPSDEARQWLQDDLPEQVKQVLRMAVKGGRLPKGCLVCKRPGQHREVWLPDAARGAGADAVTQGEDKMSYRAISPTEDAALHMWTRSRARDY